MKKNDEVKLNEKDYKASLIAQGGLNDFVRCQRQLKTDPLWA